MFPSKDHQPPGAGSSDDLKGLDILLVEHSRDVGDALKDPPGAFGSERGRASGDRSRGRAVAQRKTSQVPRLPQEVFYSLAHS
jgi:hypothetical protein